MFLAACMFLGTGLGMLFDNVRAGAIIGLGAGFLLEALFGELRNWRKSLN